MNENDKIITTPYGWIRQSEIDLYRKYEEKERNRIFHMSREDMQLSIERHKKNEDNRKWAWITIGKTRKICWVDDKTMKAYKADKYDKTYIEIKNFTFERWCTSFDL